jgi:hypothetical protein
MAKKTRDWTVGDVVSGIGSMFGGWTPDKTKDPTNVAAHPNTKFTYEPDDRSSTDSRSTLRKLGDELGGETVGANPIRYIKKVETKAPAVTPPVKRSTRQTTTVVPTKRPTATTAVTPPKQRSVRGVQSWRGGDVPQQVRYDPGTKPNPTKKQRAASGARHDFSGLKGFFK